MSLKSNGRKVKQLSSTIGMCNISGDFIPSKSMRGVANPLAVLNTNTKIVEDVLKINNKAVPLEKLESIELNGITVSSMQYLLVVLVQYIPSIRTLERCAAEVGQGRYVDSMPFSKKGIVNELLSIYNCTDAELYAHVLADMYKLNKSSEMMKFLSTMVYCTSISENEATLAYLMVLTLYPYHFYRVCYSALYAMYASSFLSPSAKKREKELLEKEDDSSDNKDEDEDDFISKYNLDHRYGICSLLSLRWMISISEEYNTKSVHYFEGVYSRYDNILETIDTENNDFYRYMCKKISIDKYITNYISSVGELSQAKREKMLECEECETDEFFDFYNSLDSDKITFISSLIDKYYCPNTMTIENALRSMVKSCGEKYFKSSYLSLFDEANKLSNKIKVMDEEATQKEKASNKEKKALVSENKKLKTNISNKEKEINKLKEKIEQKKTDSVSYDLVKKLEDEVKSLKENLESLNSELGIKVRKCEDLLSENGKLKEKLNLYGISLDDDNTSLYELLSSEDDDTVEDTIPLEEKIVFLNGYKIAICGSKRDLVNRVGERGINDLAHIDQIGNCKKNGKYDLYLICTDFISHPLRWQIETKVNEQHSKMVYFTGTNIDRMINVMYQALIK